MNLKTEPLVSVVTPVYNTEKYLAECIESILAQTYQNWEYIIVNNCSKDRSLEIAQKYAGRDARIRVHNNTQFLNQMQNWNHALRQISAESKYCKVVHADDWLFPECLSQMVAVAEANPSVGVVGSYRLDETEVNLDGLPYPSPVTSGREICRLSFLTSLYVFGSPTSLLIRSDLIRSREPFYNEANIHADKEVCFDVLQSSDFGFVHQVLTYTRRHNEATTTFTRRLSTKRLAGLIILKKYGPLYLDPEEYEQCLKRKIETYYRFLGRQVFELKDKEFWNYHQNELKALGHPLSWLKVIKAALLELLNIEVTVKRIIQAIRKKKAKPHSLTPLKQWEIVSRSES
ncbi:MAG: glycosyltransferase [Anaerolineae bacterium]|nr:glycosyltransferase [Anaerolineae bacterium]